MKLFSNLGFSLVEIMIVIALIAIVAVIAVPNLLSGKKNANEKNAIGSMKSFSSAEEIYREANKTYGTVAQLKADDQIDLTYSKSGYNAAEDIFNSAGELYGVKIYPLNWNFTGNKSLAVTSTGVLRMETGDSGPTGNLLPAAWKQAANPPSQVLIDGVNQSGMAQ